MKAFILLLLAFLPFGSNTLNVTSFGATGNGTTDDTNAIQSCLTAAAAAGKSVYFPPGKYLCNITNASKHVLEYNAAGQNYVSIYGTADTILHTISDTNTLLYVYAFSPSTHLTIAGLKFLNTHAATTAPSYGVFLQGTSGQELDTVTLRNDTLTGFQVALQAQGVTGFYVFNSGFYSPLGHDNGIHASSVPCPAIWMFDNSNGKVFNADIQGNTYNGYTGALPITVSRCSDGFVYGVAYNANVNHNAISNFSEEGIDFQPYNTIFETGSTYAITTNSNTIDASILAGSVDDNGAAHKYNYAIRVDCPNWISHYNTIKNYVWGMMSRPIDFSADSVFNFDIAYNTLITPTDTTTNIVMHDLYFVGNSYPSPSIKMYSNTTLQADTTRVFVSGASSPYTYGNVYRPTAQ